MYSKLRNLLKPKSIQLLFDPGLNQEKKLATMYKLHEYLSSKRIDINDFSSLDHNNLIIGTYYAINDNGSVQIPWNWFKNE